MISQNSQPDFQARSIVDNQLQAAPSEQQQSQQIVQPAVQQNQINNIQRQNNDIMILVQTSQQLMIDIGQKAKPQLIKQVLLTFLISIYQLFIVGLCGYNLYNLRQNSDIQSEYSLHEIFLIAMIIYQVEDNIFWNVIRCKQLYILLQVNRKYYSQSSLSRQFVQNLQIFLFCELQDENEEETIDYSQVNILDKIGFLLVQRTLYSVIECVKWRRVQLLFSWAFFMWGQYFLFHDKKYFCILYFLVFYIYITMVTCLSLFLCLVFISQLVVQKCCKSYQKNQLAKKFALRYPGIQVVKFPSIFPSSLSQQCPKILNSQIKNKKNSIQTISDILKINSEQNQQQNDQRQTEDNLNTVSQLCINQKDKINQDIQIVQNLQQQDDNKQDKLNESSNKAPHELIECEIEYQQLQSKQLIKSKSDQEDDKPQLKQDKTKNTNEDRQKGESNFKDACCSVCLDDFKPKQTVYKVKCCRSIFHTACLQNWFKQSKNCPNCRKSF